MALLGMWGPLRSRPPQEDNPLIEVGGLGSEPIPPPRRLGIPTAPADQPWSTTRVAELLRLVKRHPTRENLIAARLARHRLSQFWLGCPVDQLEFFYNNTFGNLQRLILSGPLPQQGLAKDEQAWRSNLAKKLQLDFAQPARINLLLANMLYFDHGSMQVEKPTLYLPEWLLDDYIEYFDDQASGLKNRAAKLLEPSDHLTAANEQKQTILPLPRLDERSNSEILKTLNSEGFASRMLGLINLHSIDAGDQDVNNELANLRVLLSQLWLNTPSEQLDNIYIGNPGILYRSLLRCRFGAAPLNEDDRCRRAQLVPLVSDLSQNGAVQALLAILPFFPPEGIHPAGGLEHLPHWLVELIEDLRQCPQ